LDDGGIPSPASSVGSMSTSAIAGHHVNDPGTYMPTDVLNEYKQRDPVIIAKKYFLERGGTQTEIDAINSEIDSEINSAIDFAITSPEPSLENFLQIVELS